MDLPGPTYTTPPSRGDASPAPPPPYIALLLLALVIPVIVIRDYWRRMTLGSAVVLHVLGVAIGAAGLALIDLSYNESLIASAMNGYSVAMSELVIAGIGYLIAVEAGYVFAAFATMAWGAAPEPWSRSFVRSLTRWYQLTPWHACVSLVFVGIWVTIMEQSYYGPRVGAMFFLALVSLGYGVWVVSTTLRALALHEHAPTWPAACRWPMLCEGCGYSLAGQAMDQSCPECGRAVADSTGQWRGHFRPGTAMMMGLTQPQKLGQYLLGHRPASGHGKALATGFALLIGTGPVGVFFLFIVGMVVSGEGMRFIDGEAIVGLISAGLLAGALASVVAVGIGLLGASIVGTLHALMAQRQVMHLAGQAAGYTSVGLSIWVMVNWLMIAVAMVATISARMSGPPAWMALLGLIILAVNLALAGLYLVMLNRAVNAARWANV